MNNLYDRSTDSPSRSLPMTLTTDYWVVDEQGGLADPDLVAGVPGSTTTPSPYSVTVETPVCERCSEIQDALDDRLATTMAAAHDRGCRLLSLGLRPDLLAEGSLSYGDQPPPELTASSRIRFTVESGEAVDCYNVLLALDPAFALVNTTSRVDGETRYACGRPSLYHHGTTAQYRDSSLTASPRDDRHVDTDWQPVELVDDSTVEWRALDGTDPTLLIDLVADVKTILQRAADCGIDVESFGNGFHGDRLLLPTAEWRQLYTEEAVRKGLSSLLVRAYLERFGIETDWYLAAALPTVDGSSQTDLHSVCRWRADHLEADIGLPQLGES